jgi:hypothetical protein
VDSDDFDEVQGRLAVSIYGYFLTAVFISCMYSRDFSIATCSD